MKRASAIVCAVGLVSALVLWGWFVSAGSVNAAAEDAPKAGAAQASAAPAGAPVEPDMHEFMEYVFEPAYLRLKAQMAAQPADNAAWKAIKGDSLALAEGGNLLLIRPAEDEADAWKKHAVAVRDLGGQLYRAAKAKDYKASRQHYEAMLVKCNACHQQFAAGEHQLEP
jgi:hypothetical protein